MSARILTIGYEDHTSAEVFALVRALDGTLVDVRSQPYGRVKKGFGGGASGGTLGAELGDRYTWQGHHLGGRIGCQTKSQGTTPAGLAWLRDAAAASLRPLILMCQEALADNCHRHHKIAAGLRALPSPVEVFHLFEGCADESGRTEWFIEGAFCDFNDDAPDLAGLRAIVDRLGER